MSIFPKKGGIRRINEEKLKEAQSSMRSLDIAELGKFISEGDPRLMDLLSLISWPRWDLISNQGFNIIYDEQTKNLFVGCVGHRQTLESEAEKYFGVALPHGELAWKVGYIPEGRLTSGPSTNVCFVKEFKDNVIQFITFGQWWESMGGYSRVMFGHLTQRDERPYVPEHPFRDLIKKHGSDMFLKLVRLGKHYGLAKS